VKIYLDLESVETEIKEKGLREQLKSKLDFLEESWHDVVILIKEPFFDPIKNIFEFLGL
jgi:dynactin complex subunit